MGRGRAKAKQTKVARDLKYRAHDTDFAALARELHGESDESDAEEPDQQAPEEYDDWQDQADSSR